MGPVSGCGPLAARSACRWASAGGGALGLSAGLAVAGRAAHARCPVRDPAVSARLQAAVGAQVAAGAAGALARIEAPLVGLMWGGSAGYLAHGSSRALRPGDAFRAATVTKSVTAAVAVTLAHQGRLALDGPLAGQLAPELLHRWRALDALPRTTLRQLLAHTSGLPNYFTGQAFAGRLRENPGRAWRPAELVDHAATYGTPRFPPGRGRGTPASSGPSPSTPPDTTRCWPAPTTTRRSTAGPWWPRSAGSCARQPEEDRR
jgi:D-alanyl-D-alanine carboxypeptidase